MKSIDRVEKWTVEPAYFDALNLEFIFDPDPNSIYEIPMLEPCLDIPDKLIQFGTANAQLELITKSDNTALHFFLDDYRFEKVWNAPIKYSKHPVNMGFALTPDFSIWADMPKALKVYNVYRNRWLGVFWQNLGVKVIPTISWTHPFDDFCLDGIPKHSTIAISSVGVKREHDKYFIEGVRAMCQRLEPANIVCYGPLHKFRMIFGINAKLYEFPTRWDIIKP